MTMERSYVARLQDKKILFGFKCLCSFAGKVFVVIIKNILFILQSLAKSTGFFFFKRQTTLIVFNECRCFKLTITY